MCDFKSIFLPSSMNILDWPVDWDNFSQGDGVLQDTGYPYEIIDSMWERYKTHYCLIDVKPIWWYRMWEYIHIYPRWFYSTVVFYFWIFTYN